MEMKAPKSDRIRQLEMELRIQKEIFQRYAPKVINPDNSDAYRDAKDKFERMED